jgi:hypothetical protein
LLVESPAVASALFFCFLTLRPWCPFE